ncbi:hypothetical protein [Piscibacillus halophilus]|uniref:hypothetical protein n=1 Tax=Piscibacillus halophilus TaxID=571933 RepID=UPI00240998BB|nr:hypothetical protein [Piscibacillus halophilus]
MKKIISLLIILFGITIISSNVYAHDGEHNYDPDEIAPTYGETQTWVDYYNPDVPEGRAVQHSFLWEEDKSLRAYYYANAFEGYSPPGMEIAINFDGHDTYGPGNSRLVWATGPIVDNQSGSGGTYWMNEMPYGYIDTTFSDSHNEPGANLGSGRFGLIDRGVWYNAATYLEDGNTAADDYKVRVARTHKHNEGEVMGMCSGDTGDPWCYFQDGPGFEAVESWRGNAPGETYYWNIPYNQFDYDFVDPTFRNQPQ